MHRITKQGANKEKKGKEINQEGTMQFAFQTSSVDQQIGPVSLTENSSTGFEILMGKLSQKNKVLDALSKHEFLIC